MTNPFTSAPIMGTPLLWIFAVVTSFATLASGQETDQQIDQQALLANTMRSVAEGLSDSILRIETLGGRERVEKVVLGTAPTTGVVVSEEGYIISSAFNFLNEPATILVTLPSGAKLPAKIVGRDRSRMLVLLRIDLDEDASPLQVPEWPARDEIEPGQWAVALGRTYDTPTPSMSLGIISATNRIWGRALQTDAKISPVNYGGPLTDLAGQVLGILVPLSAEDQSELAGTEYYDAGIGFAIPMEDIMRLLPKMVDGKDIFPGRLGITVEGRDIYAPGNPVIASCPARSPATAAGLKKGDVILEINGQSINSQSQMKHVLGPLNAGDTVTVKASRASENVTATVTLVAEVDPYVVPFLGVLPMRTDADSILVRHVYPDSPAEDAGIQPGDRLVRLAKETPQGLEDWRQKIAYFEPGDSVELTWMRDEKEMQADIQLGDYVLTPPDDLPPAIEGNPAQSQTAETGLVSFKLPEEPNECFALVPESYSDEKSYGVLVYFTEPGKFDREEFQQRWQALCEQNDLICLAPQPGDKAWKRSDLETSRKFFNRLTERYNVDPRRVVAHGYQQGGSMAFGFGLSNRDAVHGISVVDAVIPQGVPVSGNDPQQRIEIHLVGAKEHKLFPRLETISELLEKRKIPLQKQWNDGQSRYLDDAELVKLAHWIDVLDRI